jgi:preprotein translocase subunit SecA
MTGTAKTTEKEFQDIYNLEVVVLPTVKPLIRKDLPDIVYQTELAKWKAVLAESKTCFEKGQPILIGTASIEKSEFLSDLFKISKIPHQILNAKPENVTRESEIVAKAGEKYAVTIATNMAGRGTDIILGGNPIFKVKQEISNLLLQKNVETKTKENLSLSFVFVDPLVEKIKSDYGLEKNERLKQEINNLPYSLPTNLPSVFWYLITLEPFVNSL